MDFPRGVNLSELNEWCNVYLNHKKAISLLTSVSSISIQTTDSNVPIVHGYIHPFICAFTWRRLIMWTVKQIKFKCTLNLYFLMFIVL